MSDFRAGEIVDVTIKGARMGELSPIRVTIEDEGGHLWVLPPQAAITRVAPAEWPPLLGDLWRDRLGSVWFALGRRVLMVPGDPVGDLGGYEPDKVLAKVGPLTLVHREGADS